jgi:ABC-2 type transport system ATP-binding protein
MIKIRNLRKSYKKLIAVKDLDLDIDEGDLFGFIGPNGAGKTTTIKILATLLQPDGGSAWVGGYSVKAAGHKVRQSIGYMPDFFRHLRRDDRH